MFHEAFLEAKKSDFNHFKVGCVITYKNKIIGRGCNSEKTHPLQQKYNKRYRHFNSSNGEFVRHSIHAEMCAITSVSYIVGKNIDWNKAKIFVFRISPGKKFGFGNAKPCAACIHAIADVGIKDIFYTDDNGYSYLHLES